MVRTAELFKFTTFAECNLSKSSDEQRVVVGMATTDTPDDQAGKWQGQEYDGDVVTLEAIKAALPDYLQWSNVRDMHENKAVGTVVKATLKDNGLEIVAHIVDGEAWDKVKKKVYRGFSIGGQVLKAHLKKIGSKIYRVITKLRLTEISLVDRPANAEAKITLWKINGGRMKIQKAADPTKVVASIQELRNQAELDGELAVAQLYTEAIGIIMSASGQTNETPEGAEAEAEAMEGEGEGETTDTQTEDEVKVDQEEQKAEAGTEETTDPEAQEDDEPRKAVAKVGRAINGKRAASMHNVIQTMAKMLAEAGDPVAQKVAACYGGDEAQKVKGSTFTKADLVSSVAEALKPFGGINETMAQVQKSVTDLNVRIAAIEKLPLPGGPVLRSAVKPTPIQTEIVKSAGGEDTGIQKAENGAINQLQELNRQIAVELNPKIKAKLLEKKQLLLSNIG